jgi:hypothetical protein
MEQTWLQGIAALAANQQGFFSANYEPVNTPVSESNTNKNSVGHATVVEGPLRFNSVIEILQIRDSPKKLKGEQEKPDVGN